MLKTIDDLKTLRAELVERRREEAYRIGSAQHDEGIEKAGQVHLAIEAIDAVIAEGEDQREPPDPTVMIL
ncbi:hypothetical protein ABIE65_004974 [Constrictibacter sp. MBR-5]|jgi:hypothetical protein|uniref:hypothetical protein n=1 Tax=Constrictibacter sp. MBR-5 TaxID=3156467 RepID=UPI00339B0D3D